MLRPSSFFYLLFAGLSTGYAQTTSLIKDINQTSESSSVFFDGGPLEGNFFFGANDGQHGEELWITDGTTEGTTLFVDIHEGADGSDPREFTPLNDQLLFIANDGEHGLELWRTDGTTGGTAMVIDIVPGEFSPLIRSLTRDDNRAFFKAYHGDVFSLYVTNGTEAGTVKLRDFDLNGGQTFPDEMVVMNHVVYFRADDGNESSELWRSDGTVAGTIKVSEVSPASHHPESFHAFNNTLLFSAQDFVLYQSDGTAAGTKPFQDLLLKFCGGMTTFQGNLYFTENVVDTDGDPIDESIVKLWKYTGAAATVVFEAKVLKILGATATTLFLDVAYGEDETHALWKSNGTSGGTVAVTDITSDAGVPVPVAGLAVNDKLVFVTRDLAAGDMVWTSNGTAAGTFPIADLTETGYGWVSTESLIFVGDKIYFWADNAITGLELWNTDGTAAGTGLVKDVASRNEGSSPYALTMLNDEVIFAAYTNAHGTELWKTNGSESGTVMVKDIKLGGSGAPSSFTPFQDKLYFVADGDISGYELWSTDGTTGGTTLTADIIPGLEGSFPANLFVFQDNLYFWAGRQDGTYGLWTSDGTEDGTVFVTEDEGAFGNGVAVLDDFVIYFNTQGVWRTNGTDVGTVLLKAFTDFEPTPFAVLDEKVYFVGNDAGGLELWKTDGTAPNTQRVKDIRPGANGSFPQYLVTSHNRVLFAADDGTHGQELWKSDGSPGGTVLVKDAYAGADGAGILWIKTLDGQAFFNADDGVNGNELWRTDATAVGTTLFHDFSGDENSSFEFPGTVGVTGGKLYMNLVDDGASIGVSDGTTEGTERVPLDAAFQQSPLADQLLAFHKLVLFNGATDDKGDELWALDERDSQALTFTNPGNKAYGNPDFALEASADSGLPVRFETSPFGILDIPAHTAHILKPGEVTITAVQEGDAWFKPATIQHTITVDKGAQTITFNPIPDKVLGGPDFELVATSSVGLPVSFAQTSDKLLITSTLAEILKAGPVTITASQPGNMYYHAAAPVERSFCVRPLKPGITFDNGDWPVVLTSSQAVGNQWYLNGAPIAGATLQTFTPVETGAYTVTVTIEGCASDVSDNADVIVLGLVETTGSSLKLFPNPATDAITIQTEAQRDADGQLYAADGRSLSAFRVSQGTTVLPVDRLVPGLYFIRLEDDRGKTSWNKFFKR